MYSEAGDRPGSSPGREPRAVRRRRQIPEDDRASLSRGSLKHRQCGAQPRGCGGPRAAEGCGRGLCHCLPRYRRQRRSIARAGCLTGRVAARTHVQFMSCFAQCFRKSLHRFPETAAILDRLVIHPHAESEESILIHSFSEYVCHHIVGGNEMNGDHQA